MKQSGQKGGEATGPNPTDQGRPGTKRHIVTDRNGLPLGLWLSPANLHDSKGLIPTLDSVPSVSGKPGRPRQRPTKLHADKGYDHAFCRKTCRARGITPRIARRGRDTSQKLGRHRWTVERTFAWLARFRRLTIRYERRLDTCLAFPHPRSRSYLLQSAPMAVLKQSLSAKLKASHPECFARIEKRRAFMRDALGVAVKDSILPLSSTPLCLPPFWRDAQSLLTRG